MIIVITGTPGTGKTSVAEELGGRLGYKVVHEGEIARGSVDLRAYRLKLLPKLRGNVVVEGHLLCEVKLPADVVIVLRTRPDVLEKRLERRGYPKKKMWENVVAEAIDYCLVRAEEKYGKVYQVDTTERTVEETVERIMRILEGREGGEEVDWSEVFKEMLVRT